MRDPELKYCPECEDEYMPEIENCAACGVALITGRRMLELEEDRQRVLQNRTGKVSANDDLVGLRQGPLQDMRHIENLLRAERIGTLLVGDENSCGKNCCATSFVLCVRREDAGDALSILEKEFRRATALDHHDTTHADNIFDLTAGSAVCPACGYSFSTSTTTCPDCGLCLG